MNITELLKKNFVMIPVVVSILVGTFTGIRHVVSLTETINANKKAIYIVNNTNLKNQIKYISQLTLNQNELMMRVEREKGNNTIAQDKLKLLSEKLRQLESEFKQFLINKSN
tara:strand:+ start:114 stop:449 length:336 start_codon:yes stop_codon:yes gene_type:complete